MSDPHHWSVRPRHSFCTCEPKVATLPIAIPEAPSLHEEECPLSGDNALILARGLNVPMSGSRVFLPARAGYDVTLDSRFAPDEVEEELPSREVIELLNDIDADRAEDEEQRFYDARREDAEWDERARVLP